MATSVPNWLTAVNDAPASLAKKIRDTIAKCPDDDTGKNSVRPWTTDKTTTCHQDIAGAAVTTTTVPGDLVGDLGQGDRVAHGGGQAALVGDVDIADVAPQAGHDVFGLRNRTAAPRPVYLDQKQLTFDPESKAPAVTDLPEPAGEHLVRENSQPDVLDSKLWLRGIAIAAGAHTGDRTGPPIPGYRAGPGPYPTKFPRIGLQCDFSFDTGCPLDIESYPVPPHRKHHSHIIRRQAAGLLFLLTLVVGCSSKTLEGTPPTIEPARAAQSPPLSQAPAGVVHPFDGTPRAAVFDGRTSQLVVLTSGLASTAPARITAMHSQQTSPRIIDLPGPATGLTGDGSGNAYLSARGGYFTVDLSAGQVAHIGIKGAENVDFTAITRRADGAVVLGAADGTIYTLAPGRPTGTASNPTKVFAHVDSLAAQGNTVAVLDRGQTSVTTIGVDGKVGQQLRAGQGATTMVADPAGRLLVTDTRGGQLLVFGVDPLILRQAYPVRLSPYGLAGSRGLTWVSQTSANMVIGYDLSTGIPLEKVRYPTVRQPNALAFDDASGTLFVVSGSGGGVQVIEHAAAGPR
jgi:hypothetical protein